MSVCSWNQRKPDDQVPILDATQALALVPNRPTERPSRCQIPVDERFGEGWRNDPLASAPLGCPIESVTQFSGIVQVFERGVMYFQSAGPIWRLSPPTMVSLTSTGPSPRTCRPWRTHQA
jgi:hypothetical protein